MCERLVELDDEGKSPEVNDEARRVESLSITGGRGVGWVGGEEKGKTFSTNLTCRDTKHFLRVETKQRKTLLVRE